MFKTLDDLYFAGRRVILRGDLNVPMRDDQVTDATRLDRLAPTISQLTEGGAKVIVVSHFGRPKGKVVPEMSLQPVAAALSLSLGGKPVGFVSVPRISSLDSVADTNPTGTPMTSDGRTPSSR